jgi:hypothetical protein
MISETGEDLKVVILTQTAEDWRAFASWYSVRTNLPDALVSIICHRTTRVEFQYYQWAKRLKIPLKFVSPFYKERIGDTLSDLKGLPLIANDKVLMLDYTTVVIDVLSPEWLAIFNNEDPRLIIDDHCLVSNNMTREMVDAAIDNYTFTGDLKEPVALKQLVFEAKDSEERAAIVSYAKGCGKWIDTMIGCPFSNADGLVHDSMTVNELRIVNLWRKMVALFSTVN